MAKKPLQIAIDGPVAAGKSTVARMLSERLKITYVDTGAMYRAAAWLARQNEVDWNDGGKVAGLISKAKMQLERPKGEKKDGRLITVILDDKDISWEIRTQEIAEGASVVSQYPEVRKVLVKQQQQMAKEGSVVMEGRDICTRVLPEATLKIFMTADVNKRVKWKQAQMAQQGQNLSYASVKKALLTRDKREMTRKVDPLRPAEGVWIMDTSKMEIEGVVEAIVKRVGELDR